MSDERIKRYSREEIMATPKEIYELLAESKPSTVTLPACSIRINESDSMAAKLLLWLYENMPEDATQGDLSDVLDSAKWWSLFFAAATEGK